MSKLKGKLAKRIMAIVLSGAMVMSNMSVYAAELAPEKETEIVSEVEESTAAEEETTAEAVDTVETGNPDDAAADDTADTVGSGREDTPQSEQTDPSEDNKEASLGELTDLSATKNAKTGKWDITWSPITVSSDESNEYGNVSYKVEVKSKGAEDSAYTEVSGTPSEESSKMKLEYEFGDSQDAGEYTFRVTATAEKTGSQQQDALTKSATVDVTYTKDTGSETVAAPANVTAELNSAGDGVVVSWDAVEGATSYEVIAKGQEGAADVTFNGEIVESNSKKTATFSIGEGDNALTRGKSYKFSVSAKKDGVSPATTETQDALAIPEDSENPPAPSEGETTTYVLTGADVGLVAKGAKADTTDRAGTDGYFKLNYTSSSQLDNNTTERKWQESEGTVAYILPKNSDTDKTYRIRMDKYSSGTSPAVGFTTDAQSAEVRVWWGANGDGQYVKLVDSAGQNVTGLDFTTASTKNTLYYNSWTLQGGTDASTYYIVNQGGGNYLYKAEVIETRTEEKEREAWSKGTNPSISMAMKTNEDGTTSTDTVAVNVSGISLSDDGADKLVVEIFKDGVAEAVDTKVVMEQGITSYSYEYQITESGSYKAKATLSRTIAGEYDDTNKTATNKDDTANAKTAESTSVAVDLSLNAPENFTAQQVSKKYEVKLSWDIVNGGDGYQITVSEKDAAEVLATYSITDKTTKTYTATGYGEDYSTVFEAGKSYTFTIKSTKGEELSEDSATADVTIEEVVDDNTSKSVHTLDVNEMETATYTTDEDISAGTDDYFTLLALGEKKTAIQEVNDSTTYSTGHPVWSDGFEGLKRINFAGKAQKNRNAIKFTTEGAATVKVWWVNAGGSSISSNRQVEIFTDTGFKNKVANSEETYEQHAPNYSELSLTKEGTYYLGCSVNTIHIYKIAVEETVTVTENNYTLDVNEMETATYTTDEDISAGTDDYFTLLALGEKKTAIQEVNDSTTYSTGHPVWSDGFEGLKRINFAGKAQKNRNAIKFTTEGAATVKVWWVNAGGSSISSNRQVEIFTDTGFKNKVANSEETYEQHAPNYSELSLTKEGTYYLGCSVNTIHIYKIVVTETKEGGGIDRGDWEKVDAPEIISAQQTDGKITVTAKGVINTTGEGADYITIEMYNAEHLELANPKPIASKISKKDTAADALTTVEFSSKDESGAYVFESGTYVFKAILSRKDTVFDENGNETVVKDYGDKSSSFSDSLRFKLPLESPVISDLQNEAAGSDGLGIVSVTWDKVSEADYYELLATDENGATIESKKELGSISYRLKGLEIGKTISVKVKAYRDDSITDVVDESEWSAAGVIKVTGEEPKGYTFDALDYTDDATTDGIAQPAGTKFGTSNYFTAKTRTVDGIKEPVAGIVKLRKNSSGSSAWLELEKSGSATFEFTVYGTASASFSVASTGSSNKSIFGLLNPKGEPVSGSISGSGSSTVDNVTYVSGNENKGPAYIASGTGITTIRYDNLEAGTYSFLVPLHKDYDRAGRLHKAVIYDSGDMPVKDTWGEDTTGTPVITEITYIKGESDINVTANGYIGYNGADSLRVDMLDKDGKVVASVVKAAESTVNADGSKTNVDQTFTFTPTASGDYSFRASLVRSGETDIVMKDSTSDWTMKDFVLPLSQASVSSMTNVSDTGSTDEKPLGGLEVIFPSVDEADYYVVTAFSKEGKELVAKTYTDIEAYKNEEGKEYKLASETDKENKYTVTLHGMPTGTAYIITQAFRKADSSLNLTAGKKILTRTVNPETGEVKIETKDSPVSEWLNDQWKADKKAEVQKSNAQDKDKNETDDAYAARIDSLVQLLVNAVSETADGKATAVVRSMTSDAKEKYINGKNDTRWFHSVFGSNTSSAVYTRKKEMNDFDGAYKKGDDEYNANGSATVPQNGYKEHTYTEGANAGDLKSVELWSENGRGKVVPASTDGLSYYYTTIDPSQDNFTLSALIHVMSWEYTNGQDGFGMMVSDTVGKNGDDGATWTNAYQLLASKIQYSWYRATKDENGNTIPGYVTNAGGNGTTIMRYEMKLGVGWNSKEGATAADVAKIKSGASTAPANFLTDSGTLETSAGNNDLYTGSYNAIGNGYNKSAIPTSSVKDDKELLTDFRFQIRKYNNAYVLRYLEVNAATDLTDEDKASGQYAEMNDTWYKIISEQVFSDENNNKLTQIDKQNIYIGFFAARKARIDISQIDLDVTKANENDVFTIPTTEIDPSASFSSEETSNSKDYDLVFGANFDGSLTIYKEDKFGKEAVVAGKAITAGTKYTFTNELREGETKFTYYAKPDENFVPGDNQKLKNFDMQTNEKDPFPVTYHAFSGNEIYVAQNGAPIGTPYTVQENDTEVTYYAGSSASYPTNVYDAVNYAAAGQTIILAGGMYNLTEDPNHSIDGAAENLLIGKGHDGTSRKNITMTAAPEATGTNRPILNFGQSTIKNDTAFIMAGNYWYFKGFDVMGSRDGQKGVLLGGSHNILNDVRTYLNGNTGLQVARYANYGREDWPSYNTILNCSSFMNYDAGYEDADGYAAKLTCGDGNKFVGCIAAYNADDGWDLFAKVESGSIGVVTIENCLAFKNGYLFGEEDYYGSGSDLIYRYTNFNRYTKNTHIVDAGNGNGFKMGGDSMSGYHVLKNSIAFGNKSKGIDSNSCPDIQIYNSISFNNELNNVALYTGGAVNTDFYAEHLVSIKDSNAASGYSTGENFDLRGTQNENKIYSATNYYWNGVKSVNANNDAFDLSWFKYTSITNAIFGSKAQNRISRTEDGSINLNGFLEYTEEGLAALKLQNSVIGTTPAGDVLDPVIDLYVFADEYKGKATLSQINLKDFESTKALAEAGYSWKKEKDANGVDVEVELAAFAGTTAEFTAVAAGKQDRTIAISFIQLDGAELLVTDGDTNNNGILNDGETWTVEAVPVISPAVEPYNVKLSGFAAEVKETTKGLLTAEGSATVGAVNAGLNVIGGQVKYKGSGSNGDAKLTATVTLTVNGKAVKKNATLDVKVKNARNIKFDSIEISDPKKLNWTPDNDYIEIDRTAESFTMKNLRALDDKGAEIGTKGVKIKVNDTNIIKLSQAPKGNNKDAVFQIVDKNNDGGTATVTVTSADDKTLVRDYIVTLKGSEFAWNAANVEVDKAKLAGVQVSLLEPFGKKLAKDSEIKVKEVYKGAKVVEGRADSDLTKMFTVKSLAAGTNVYELNTSVAAAGKAGIAKGTYTLVCEAKTTTTVEGADPTIETTAFTPITIKVTESKPAVTFKQTKKVNFFYKKGTAGSTGKLLLSSKQGKVTLVADVDKDGKAKAIKTANGYFRFAGTGTEYDIIADNKNSVTVDPTNGRADFKEAKADGKISLTAHVEGYYPEYDVVKNISVAMEYKQPKLKLTAIDKTIYTAIGMKSADVLIYDPVADMYLGTDIATIELKGSDAVNKKAYSKINDNFTVGEVTGLRDGKNGVRLTLKEGAEKGGALRLSISYDDWISGDAVIVNQSIQVTNSIPKLTVKPAKLNMNPEKFVGKEQVDVPVIMNGAEGFTISEYTVTGSNDKATAFLTDYVDAKLVKNIDGNYVLRMSLKKKDGKFPAEANRGVYKMSAGYASSYGFVLKYKLGTMENELTTPVKLSLVSKEAVTVGVAGSINMANRLGSTITLKPKMQNFTAAQISSVKLTGDAANLFEIVSHDRATGATIVRAKETAVLKKGNYKVTPEFTIDLGKEGSTTIRPLKPIVIKTAQPTLKISGLKDALEVKLSSHTTSAKRTITVGTEGAYITDMTQTSGLNNFKLSYDAGGNNVIVTIKDRAGLKEGTVYKITALISVEGGGTNVKQQVITIPVRVIR